MEDRGVCMLVHWVIETVMCRRNRHGRISVRGNRRVSSNEIKRLTMSFGDRLNRPKTPETSHRALAGLTSHLLLRLITRAQLTCK